MSISYTSLDIANTTGYLRLSAKWNTRRQPTYTPISSFQAALLILEHFKAFESGYSLAKLEFKTLLTI
jgi:hypothetical protein